MVKITILLSNLANFLLKIIFLRMGFPFKARLYDVIFRAFLSKKILVKYFFRRENSYFLA